MAEDGPRGTAPASGVADLTGEATLAARAREHPFGPSAPSILATEHWGLLASRSLIWNEAMSRANVFLTVLSAAIIALALVANATGFGPRTTTLALVLLPVVLLLGIATFVRLVQINTEDAKLVLAMNRLRHAYLRIEPGLEPYFTTGDHDDERGMETSYMLHRLTRAGIWAYFLVSTPTIVATVDAALATVIVVLIARVAEAPWAVATAAGVATFAAVFGVLFPLQREIRRSLRDTGTRFPTPPVAP